MFISFGLDRAADGDGMRRKVSVRLQVPRHRYAHTGVRFDDLAKNADGYGVGGHVDDAEGLGAAPVSKYDGSARVVWRYVDIGTYRLPLNVFSMSDARQWPYVAGRTENTFNGRWEGGFGGPQSDQRIPCFRREK